MKPGPNSHWVTGPPGWLAAAILIAAQLATAAYFLTDRSPGTAAAWTGFPLDDAWIHLVYGRAVATGGLPCYNAGTPEAGFTSPAWMLVCAAAHWLAAALRLDIVVVVKFLGICAAAAMTLGIYAVTRIITNDRWGPLLAALLTALTPALAFSQIAGMEVCLAPACGLWSLYALRREKYLLTGLLLAAAFWARPEMIVLGALVVLAVLAVWRTRALRDKRAALLKLTLPLFVAAALWSGYCLAVTGRPLPNTFYAKFVAASPSGFVTILREILWPLPANALLAGLLLYVLGIVALLRRRGAVLLIALLFPWLFFLAIALSRQMLPGSGAYYYWLRYAVPGIPFLYIALGAGWSLLWQARPAAEAQPPAPAPSTTARQPGTTRSPAPGRSPAPARSPAARSPAPTRSPAQTRRPTRARLAALPPSTPQLRPPTSSTILAARAIAILLAVLSFVPVPGPLRQQREQYAWNCQNINEVQVAIGQWLAANTPPDARVVVVDAGASRYFGQRRTIDLIGLNFHTLEDQDKLGQLLSSPLAMRNFLRSQNAQYLSIFPDLFPAKPESQRLFRGVFHARSPHYTVAEAVQNTMVVLALR
jgi:hypothetical protein